MRDKVAHCGKKEKRKKKNTFPLKARVRGCFPLMRCTRLEKSRLEYVSALDLQQWGGCEFLARKAGGSAALRAAIAMTDRECVFAPSHFFFCAHTAILIQGLSRDGQKRQMALKHFFKYAEKTRDVNIKLLRNFPAATAAPTRNDDATSVSCRLVFLFFTHSPLLFVLILSASDN